MLGAGSAVGLGAVQQAQLGDEGLCLPVVLGGERPRVVVLCLGEQPRGYVLVVAVDLLYRDPGVGLGGDGLRRGVRSRLRGGH